MTKVRVVLLFALLLLGISMRPQISSAQSERSRYFPETGHSVSGDFLVAYEKASDPIKIYGYPITGVIDNPITNRKVQYFQRAHFELHPENPSELRVQITHLGEIIYLGEIMNKPGDVLMVPQNHPACRHFPETDHQVCYAFLDFFQKYGGIAQFGYPISEIELRSDRMIQCFQIACFEWHPELPSGHRVTLMDLGRLYFEARKENPRELLSGDDDFIPKTILGLQVRAFPEKAVLSKNSQQILHVIVQDQNLQPISGAQVEFIVHTKDGDEESHFMPATDKNGITTLSFPINQEGFGIVQIFVSASYDGFEQQTRTSFRLWW
jgi:hypothetical protein